MTKFELTLPDDMIEAFHRLAERRGQSTQDVIASALQSFLTHNQRWDEDMKAALQDVENGFGVDGEDVLDWMDSWGRNDERPRPLPTRTA